MQKEYFKTRSRDALSAAKNLEHKVDGIIEESETHRLF